MKGSESTRAGMRLQSDTLRQPWRRCLAGLAACALSGSLLAAESVAPQDCELPGAIVATGLPEQRLVLLGELHGTQEAPALLATWACQLSRKGLPVLVVLELPSEEQERLDVFMHSPGAADDRRRLLQGWFWQRPQGRQDGRSSQAMFQLVESLRALRAGGAELALRAVDVSELGSSPRDAQMSVNLRGAMEAHPTHRVLGLFGNVHVALQRGSSWDDTFESLGYLLKAEAVHALNISSKRGSAWACWSFNSADKSAMNCSSRSFGKPDDKAVAQLETGELRYDATWWLPRLTASPPARDADTARQPGS